MKKNYCDKASELFNAGCACSQSVFVPFCGDFGLDEKTAMRLSCGLGGGVGRLREVCGAVSAMALLAGLKYGSERPDDAAAKQKTYEAVQAMANAFLEKHGSLICRELLALDRPEGSAVPSERTDAYYATRPCAQLVRDAAEIAARFLV